MASVVNDITKTLEVKCNLRCDWTVRSAGMQKCQDVCDKFVSALATNRFV